MDFHEYFNNVNLRKVPKVGIHFEQKTTPDLLWCVASVILDITRDDHDRLFTDAGDVRRSKVFDERMQDYFSKPPQHEAEREYDKVSRYQLGLLEFAGLIETAGASPTSYRVVNREALEFIAMNDLNASKFLTEYTEKLLKDNGLWSYFERYLQHPTQDNYVATKDAYWQWARVNTDVRTTNPQHSYRVFNKIFNVVCYKHRQPGQHLSRVTSGPCPYSFLIYNRENFRDQDKPPGMSRQDYAATVITQIDNEGVVATALKKAKDSVARKYGDSEIRSTELGYQPNSGTHVHHILPISSYPQFSLTRENLIALTPGQHLSRAHPRANTQRVDPLYQAICLKAKYENILRSEELGEEFYKTGPFIDVVDALYGWELPYDISSRELLDKISDKVTELS